MTPAPRGGGRGRDDGRGNRGRPPRPAAASSRGGSERAAPRRRDGGQRAPERSQSQWRGLGGEQVEGRHAVLELLLGGRRRARDIWVAEGADDAAIVQQIVELAGEQRVPVRMVARGRLDAEARTDAAQGVLAHADPLPEVDLERLCRRRRDAAVPFLVVFDGITDPQNLGALLRTAECAGATGAVLPRHRAVHVTPTVTKAAAGAVEHLPMAVVPGIPTSLALMSSLGVWTVGLAEDAERSIYDLDVATEPLALVFGAEGTGLSRLARARCDLVVAIPQRGTISSLNVAAAGAVACFEVTRRRATAAPPDDHSP